MTAASGNARAETAHSLPEPQLSPDRKFAETKMPTLTE